MSHPLLSHPKKSPFRVTEKSAYVYLGLIVAMAAGLRLYHLDYQSLGLDEIFSVNPTAPGQSLASLIKYCKSDQPPAYFVLLWTWFKLFPYNDFSARLLSALLGVLGVIAMFFLGKEFKNASVGLFVSLITSLIFYHLYFSQEARFYTLLFLLTVLSYLYFLKSLKNPIRMNFARYCFFSIGLVYTHYFGPLVVMAQAVTFLVLVGLGKREKMFVRSAIVAGMVIFLAYLPWLPTIFTDLGITSFWIARPEPFFFLDHIRAYLNYDPYSFAIVALLIVLASWKFVQGMSNRSERSGAQLRTDFIVLSIWIVFAYGLPYAYSIWRTSVLVPRYTLIALPALLVYCALGWSYLPKIAIRGVVLFTLVFFLARTIFFNNWYYTAITKTQFREVAQEVVRQNTALAPLYSDRDWFYNYYLRSLQSNVMSINPAYIDFESELAKQQEIWIIRAFLGGVVEHPIPLPMIEKYFVEKKRISYYDAYAVQYVRK